MNWLVPPSSFQSGCSITANLDVDLGNRNDNHPEDTTPVTSSRTSLVASFVGTSRSAWTSSSQGNWRSGLQTVVFDEPQGQDWRMRWAAACCVPSRLVLNTLRISFSNQMVIRVANFHASLTRCTVSTWEESCIKRVLSVAIWRADFHGCPYVKVNQPNLAFVSIFKDNIHAINCIHLVSQLGLRYDKDSLKNELLLYSGTDIGYDLTPTII